MRGRWAEWRCVDFELGRECVWGHFETSGGAVRSVSCTQIYFQPKTTALPTICKAIGTLFGKGWSTPGAGVVDYTCYITIDRVIPDNLEWSDPKEPAALLLPNYQVTPPMLKMPADVLFQFNRADLKPSAAHALQQALQLITTQRVRSVIIEGHTDSIGSAHYTQNPSRLGFECRREGTITTSGQYR
jgi:hypothetical protein